MTETKPEIGQEVEMQYAQQGFKTSEFYVVLAVLVPWVSRQFGIDLTSFLTNPDDLIAVINSARAQGTDAPVWAALVYVAGRVLLKWRGGGR